MKQLILTVLFLAVSLNIYAQYGTVKCDYYTKYLIIADEVLEKGLPYQDNKTASGMLCFENKVITLKNGYADGLISVYYPNGLLQQTIIYSKGQRKTDHLYYTA